jgi:hypothetical protein
LVQAIAAPTQIVNLTAAVYFKGASQSDVQNGLLAAWRALLQSVPLGGFDFSPGPSHIILTSDIEATLKSVTGVTAVVVSGISGIGITVALNTKVIEGTETFTLVALNG